MNNHRCTCPEDWQGMDHTVGCKSRATPYINPLAPEPSNPYNNVHGAPYTVAPRRHKLDPGRCAYCDRERAANNSFHPSHDAASWCKSGAHPHCTCDTCF